MRNFLTNQDTISRPRQNEAPMIVLEPAAPVYSDTTDIPAHRYHVQLSGS